MDQPLQLAGRREAGALVLVLQGRLDGNTSAQLETFLAQQVAPEDAAVVLDCAQLSYVSSAGLREFLRLAKQLHKQHRSRPVLAALQPNVAEAVEIAGFGALLHVAPDLPAALALAQGGDAPKGLLGRLFG
jgi:anti-anti-sigma factor